MGMSWQGREHLGRIVRNVWVDNLKEHYKQLGTEPPAERVLAWEDLPPEIKEADMRLGEALYFWGANDMSNHIAGLDAWEYAANEDDVDRASKWLTPALGELEKQLGKPLFGR